MGDREVTRKVVRAKKLDPALTRMFSIGLRKGDRRKAEIVEAIVRIVTKEGFESLSFDRIGKETGMTKSHVVYHFPSKDEMIRMGYQFILASGQVIVVEELTKANEGRDRLLAYIRGHFEWLLARPEQVQFLMLIYTRCRLSKELREMNAEARTAARERISAMIPKSAKLKPRDRDRWAKHIHDHLTGALLDLVIWHGTPTKKQVEEKTREVLRTVASVWDKNF